MTRSLRTDPPALRAARRATGRVVVRVTPPRPGYVHPASRHEVEELLAFFGPLAVYGLRSVEMCRAVAGGDDRIVLARLRVPGRVTLYEQPLPPWVVRGLSKLSAERLVRAGAAVAADAATGAAWVDWPDQTLRDFILFDGLMHEIGHHLVQHHRGKRSTRVMRTADHEHRADAYADVCRAAWTARSASG